MQVEIPWYMKSPSPWTIGIWIILIFWAGRVLLKRVEYRRPRLAWLFSLTDAALILGFMTSFSDLIWCVACGLRFGPYFPFYPDVYGLILAAARDVAAMVFFFLIIGHYFGQYVRVNRSTYVATFAYVLFLAAWFSLAPDLSFVDWNFAIKHGHPLERVVQDFLVSHIFGRALFVAMFVSIFRTRAGFMLPSGQVEPAGGGI